MSLEIDVGHRQGGFSLDARFAADGRLTALFGRWRAGPTTRGNIITRCMRRNRGRTVVDGEALVDTERGLFVPAHRRGIGYVFQEGRLFPHLTVRQNLLFGRWFSSRRDRTGPDLPAVVDLLGIAALLARRPGALSGGEKQRVAIGRALLARPRLLLMDEPLASLDEARKQEILPYLERLRDTAGVPIVYVSHAVPEVARLATSLVVLEAGRVAAAGPAAGILGRLDLASPSPHHEAGAELEATVVRHDDPCGVTVLSTRGGELQVPRMDCAPGTRLRVQFGRAT